MSNDGSVSVEAPSEAPLLEEDPQAQRRAAVVSLAGLLAAVLIAVLTVLPAQFAIGGPGETFDTLGVDDEGDALLEISGAPTYEASGALWITTVAVIDASSRPFTMGRVLAGWFAPQEFVAPNEVVFGTPEEEDAVSQQAQTDWITSQESATVAAVEALGDPVPATIRVAEVMDGSNAVGKLLPDDIIVAVDGTPIVTYADMSDAMAAKSPGDDVAVTVERGVSEVDVTFATQDDGQGNAVMGIWVDPAFDIPIDVSVHIDRVGGPSAGLMFSLGIMDLLTPEDELAGERVAGTGTISASGDVGPIGGIRMKMFGAVDAGAEFFLSPIENCSDVVGNVPSGLRVVSVDTLDDAYDAVVAIGRGDTDDLPSC